MCCILCGTTMPIHPFFHLLIIWGTNQIDIWTFEYFYIHEYRLYISHMLHIRIYRIDVTCWLLSKRFRFTLRTFKFFGWMIVYICARTTAQRDVRHVGIYTSLYARAQLKWNNKNFHFIVAGRTRSSINFFSKLYLAYNICCWCCVMILLFLCNCSEKIYFIFERCFKFYRFGIFFFLAIFVSLAAMIIFILYVVKICVNMRIFNKKKI